MQTVERIRATSVQTRLRTRSGVGAPGVRPGTGSLHGDGPSARGVEYPRMILERIAAPADVKRLSRPELDQLAREIRET